MQYVERIIRPRREGAAIATRARAPKCKLPDCKDAGRVKRRKLRRSRQGRDCSPFRFRLDPSTTAVSVLRNSRTVCTHTHRANTHGRLLIGSMKIEQIDPPEIIPCLPRAAPLLHAATPGPISTRTENRMKETSLFRSIYPAR